MKPARILSLAIWFGLLTILIVGNPFHIFAQTSHKLTLSWLASPTAGVKYNVYRGTSATGTFLQIATDVVGLTYADSNGVAGTTYFYEVSAICDTTTTCPTGITGESALSAVSNGTTFLGNPAIPPAAPTVTAQ